MNELAVYRSGLPDKIGDVAKFLLIAPEKAKALRAEIKAIQKLKLAQEVYDQKMEEQRHLQELILDAAVKVGEFTKALPKATESKGNQHSGKWISDNTVTNPKSKVETIKELGFTKKQVGRFETLAENKDLVEQVKAESRQSGEAPTRTKVLELSQIRKQMQETEMRHTEKDFDNLKQFRRAVSIAALCDIDDTILNSVAAVDQDIKSTIEGLQNMIEMLVTIRQKLMLRGARNGEKQAD